MQVLTGEIPMPLIRPVPLRTRGRAWWRRAIAWLWDARTWVVVDEYRYTKQSGEVLMIPAGFETDFASSPRLFWLAGMDPTGILLIPSLFHDFGYRHDFYLDGDGRRIHVGAGKGFHERMLREICAEVNGMVVPGTVAWLALDVFGWPAWWRASKRRTGDINLQVKR